MDIDLQRRAAVLDEGRGMTAPGRAPESARNAAPRVRKVENVRETMPRTRAGVVDIVEIDEIRW